MGEMNGIALRFAQTPSSISHCIFSSPFRKWRIRQWPIVEASLSLKQQPIFSLLFSSYNFSLSPFSSSPSLPLGHSFLLSLLFFTFSSLLHAIIIQLSGFCMHAGHLGAQRYFCNRMTSE